VPACRCPPNSPGVVVVCCPNAGVAGATPPNEDAPNEELAGVPKLELPKPVEGVVVAPNPVEVGCCVVDPNPVVVDCCGVVPNPNEGAAEVVDAPNGDVAGC